MIIQGRPQRQPLYPPPPQAQPGAYPPNLLAPGQIPNSAHPPQPHPPQSNQAYGANPLGGMGGMGMPRPQMPQMAAPPQMQQPAPAPQQSPAPSRPFNPFANPLAGQTPQMQMPQVQTPPNAYPPSQGGERPTLGATGFGNGIAQTMNYGGGAPRGGQPNFNQANPFLSGQGSGPASGQGDPRANIAQQLQDSRDRANAENIARYGEQKSLNEQGLNTLLSDQNQSYQGLAQMPGQSAGRQSAILDRSRSQQMDLSQRGQAGLNNALAATSQDQLGAIGRAGGNLDRQAAQFGQQQQGAIGGAYGGLLDMAQGNGANQVGFVDSAYGNLMGQANAGGDRQMNFLNQQNQQMQGMLGNFSNAEYQREGDRTKEQMAQIALDMADRGLSSSTLDQALKRGVMDDSALRQAEIGDRRLGRQVDAANTYTGRGLGVMGQSEQNRFNAGSAYANAGLGARQYADTAQQNIAGRGVDTSLEAQRQADQARLGMGERFAQQDIGARADLGRMGLNIAQSGLNRDLGINQEADRASLGIAQDQGSREQSMAAHYADQRQNAMDSLRRERIGIIGARTDEGPDESAYLSLLSQAGASGRGGGGSPPMIYNPQGGGHVRGRGGGGGGGAGNPFFDITQGNGGFSGANLDVTSSDNPSGHSPRIPLDQFAQGGQDFMPPGGTPFSSPGMPPPQMAGGGADYYNGNYGPPGTYTQGTSAYDLEALRRRFGNDPSLLSPNWPG